MPRLSVPLACFHPRRTQRTDWHTLHTTTRTTCYKQQQVKQEQVNNRKNSATATVVSPSEHIHVNSMATVTVLRADMFTRVTNKKQIRLITVSPCQCRWVGDRSPTVSAFITSYQYPPLLSPTDHVSLQYISHETDVLTELMYVVFTLHCWQATWPLTFILYALTKNTTHIKRRQFFNVVLNPFKARM